MDISVVGDQIEDRGFTNEQLANLSMEFHAFDAEVGNGHMSYPVPTGTDDPPGDREVVIEDDGVLIGSFFIGDQTRTRVSSDVLVPWREYTLTLRDSNVLMGGFIVYQVRPEETDYERVLHWVTTLRPTWDTSMILDEDTVTMPAKTYRDANGFAELLADTREASGKTMFVHDKRDGSGRCFHYHSLLTGHTSTLVLTDQREDWNYDDVWPVMAFPRRQRNPADLVTKVVGTDQAGRRAVVEDATQSALHDADGMAHEELMEFEAQSQAELLQKTQIAVTERSRERETYICGVPHVPAAVIARWNAGDLLNVTSNVLGLPGTIGPLRIAHATITLSRDRNGVPLAGFYDCLFELGQPLRVRKGRLSGATNPIKRPLTPFVPSDTCEETAAFTPVAVAMTQEVDGTSGALPAMLNAANAIDGNRATSTLHDSGAIILNGTLRRYWEFDFGVAKKVTNYTLYDQGSGGGSGSTQHGLLEYSTDGTTWTALAHSDVADPLIDGYTGAISGPVSARYLRIGFSDTGGGATAVSGTSFSEFTFVVCTTDGQTVPAYGQKTCEEVTGDGTTGPYTLNYPYLPGSVEAHGKQSGLAWVVDETDPMAGEFETASLLPSGQVLVVCYQANGGDGTGEANPQPTPAAPTATTGTDLGWFNVRDYGATGDGVTDDTDTIQAAIDACAAAGGGTVWFPVGEYVISGALQDTGAFNGQLLLPNVSHSDPHISIVFRGALAPGFHPVYGSDPLDGTGYSILRSTLTGASGTAAVVSGGNNLALPSSGGGNNLAVGVVDLVCLGPNNPTFTFWNLGACQPGPFNVQISTPGAFAGTPTEPTNSNAYGIKLPQAYFSNGTPIDTIAAGGFYTGVLAGELMTVGNLILGPCIRGIEIPDLVYPGFTIGRLTATSVQRVVYASGAGKGDILTFITESTTGGAAWLETLYHVDDASDQLDLFIRHHLAETGGGADTLRLNGGAGVIDGGAIGTAWNGAPTGAAGGDLSGTYPNPSVVNDSHSHTASTIDLTGEAAGGDLSGTYPNPSVVDDSHSHTAATLPAAAAGGRLLLADDHASPIVFDDILQADDFTDFLYSEA